MTNINEPNWKNIYSASSNQGSTIIPSTSSSGVTNSSSTPNIDIEASVSDFQNGKISLEELR